MVIAILITLGLIYYRHRQIQWQEYKRQVEGQKAEEITIRIIEGWSNREIGQYLEKEGIVGATDFLKSVKTSIHQNIVFCRRKQKATCKAFLYPDSYRLFKSLADRAITIGPSFKTIIAKLLDTFEKASGQCRTACKNRA